MLIIWSWIPCKQTGAGILMRRLFSSYPPDRLWALTSASTKRIAARYDPVPPPERQVSVTEIQIPRRWIDRLAQFLNRLLIPWIVWRGVRLARKEKIEALFTVPWDQFTIAAYLIHRITSLPMYMYIMDDPAGTRRAFGFRPVLYSFFMPGLVRACKRIWGVSDGMCEYFEKTYGVRCLPLLPLLNIEDFQTKAVREADRADGSFHIVFTGSIYSAQVDAVRRLVHVVDREAANDGGGQARMRLTLYTSSSSTALEKMGLAGRNVRRDEVRQEDIARAMAEADVAFLPLSFEPDMRHIVETSFPSKTAEYLAAGVPILVHAPSHSAVARYCREQECALVVDEPNETALHDALLRLQSDAALRRRLSAKARETAEKNHDVLRVAPAVLDQLACGILRDQRTSVSLQ